VSLTRVAIVMLALAAAVGIVAQWSGSLLADVWWRAAVALVAAGLAYELYVTRGLLVVARWTRDSPLYLGRGETLDLELENGTRRDLTIEVAPAWPAGIAGEARPCRLRVAPRATARAALAARAVGLGVQTWPPLPARIKGPLNLAWWSRRLAPDGAARVLPDTLGPRGAMAASVEGATARYRAGSGHELHHLREYRSGDPRHTIDWKATARSARLITRVFSEDQHLEVMVLVDAGRTSRTEIDGLQQLGHYANAAARFAEYCVANDDLVGLIAFADRPLATLEPARGARAVTRIRNALTGLTPGAVESDVLAAALHVSRLVRHRCLVVILTDLYERSATSALAQSARLLVPKHLPLIVGILSDDVVELAERAADDWLDPYRAFAAREYRRHVGANVARLGRLGAYAMTARARELDRKILETYRRLRAQRRV
jgi:uncharacterized protein (DUF58 family)